MTKKYINVYLRELYTELISEAGREGLSRKKNRKTTRKLHVYKVIGSV
jgi:hypothetical protein